MAQRLTINEFDFLIKVLRAVEDTGDTAIRTGTLKNCDEIISLFGVSRSRIIDTTNKVRILRSKIEEQSAG